jgi:DNA-directed RNA polymerase subunit RPC12/RpoP
MLESLESDPELECTNPDCRSKGLDFVKSHGAALVNRVHEDCGGLFNALQDIGKLSDYECTRCGSKRSFTVRTYQCPKCQDFTDVDIMQTVSKSGEVTVQKIVSGEFRLPDAL